jgi:hypothetical protein
VSVTFASLKYPLSAVACCGWLPVTIFTCSNITVNLFYGIAREL